MNSLIVAAGGALVAIGFFGLVVPGGVVAIVRGVTVVVTFWGSFTGDWVDPASGETARMRRRYRRLARVVSGGIVVAGLAIVGIGLTA